MPAGVVNDASVIRFVVLPRVSREPFYRNRVVVVFVKPMQVVIHESSRLSDRRNGIAYHVVFTIISRPFFNTRGEVTRSFGFPSPRPS